jgi:hypothetical protein
MDTNHRDALPAEFGEVRAQFDNWRHRRSKGERIPEELWSAAGDAGRRFGVSRVCRALRLDYYQLKRRSGSNGEADEPAVDPAALFVEWKMPPGEREPVCVVELEKKNGTRLRVSARDAEAVDWFRIKEAFLGA